MIADFSCRPAAVAVAVLLAACATGPSDDEADGDTATTAATTYPRLAAGSYYATTNGLLDDTCGGLAEGLGLVGADVDLFRTSETELLLEFPCCAASYTCTVDASGAVTCDGYRQRLLAPRGVTLSIDVAVVDFVALSTTRFDQKEVATFACDEMGCDAQAEDWATTFPCSVTIDESYAM